MVTWLRFTRVSGHLYVNRIDYLLVKKYAYPQLSHENELLSHYIQLLQWIQHSYEMRITITKSTFYE